MTRTTALVLGGGGVTGIAWEIGLLAALAEGGVDLTGADVVVGTSAGSVVGALVTTGSSLEDLYASQLRPPSGEISARLGLRVAARYGLTMVAPGTSQQRRARLGRAALRAATADPAERVAVIRERLGDRDWALAGS